MAVGKVNVSTSSFKKYVIKDLVPMPGSSYGSDVYSAFQNADENTKTLYHTNGKIYDYNFNILYDVGTTQYPWLKCIILNNKRYSIYSTGSYMYNTYIRCTDIIAKSIIYEKLIYSSTNGLVGDLYLSKDKTCAYFHIGGGKYRRVQLSDGTTLGDTAMAFNLNNGIGEYSVGISTGTTSYVVPIYKDTGNDFVKLIDITIPATKGSNIYRCMFFGKYIYAVYTTPSGSIYVTNIDYYDYLGNLVGSVDIVTLGLTSCGNDLFNVDNNSITLVDGSNLYFYHYNPEFILQSKVYMPGHKIIANGMTVYAYKPLMLKNGAVITNYQLHATNSPASAGGSLIHSFLTKDVQDII